MPTIKEIKVKVDLARNGIEQETATIISDNEVKILDYIRSNQLYENGIDGEGKVIGTYKRNYNSESVGGWGNVSKITSAGLPKKIGQPYNFVWSGYTVSNFKTDYSNFELTIFNQGGSTQTLERKYGKSIFLLADENKVKLSTEIIRPNLIKYFNTFFK